MFCFSTPFFFHVLCSYEYLSSIDCINIQAPNSPLNLPVAESACQIGFWCFFCNIVCTSNSLLHIIATCITFMFCDPINHLAFKSHFIVFIVTHPCTCKYMMNFFHCYFPLYSVLWELFPFYKLFRIYVLGKFFYCYPSLSNQTEIFLSLIIPLFKVFLLTN